MVNDIVNVLSSKRTCLAGWQKRVGLPSVGLLSAAAAAVVVVAAAAVVVVVVAVVVVVVVVVSGRPLQ